VEEEQSDLGNAQAQMNQYVHHVEEAIIASGPEEMRRHVAEAMPFGVAAADNLEDALSETEDPEAADRIEEAMHHLGLSMDHGDQALEAPDDEVENFLSEMQKHALQSASFVGELVSAAT